MIYYTTLHLQQNGHHFPQSGGILLRMQIMQFSNAMSWKIFFCVLIKISMRFVAKGLNLTITFNIALDNGLVPWCNNPWSIVWWAFSVKLPSDECHRVSSMMSQNRWVNALELHLFCSSPSKQNWAPPGYNSTSHYLKQWWPWFMSRIPYGMYGFTRQHWVKLSHADFFLKETYQ